MCGFASSGVASGTAMAALLTMPALLAIAGVALWATLSRQPWRQLVTTAQAESPAPAHVDVSIALLRERFATGEIDVATFEERVTHLLRMDQEGQV